MTNINFQIEDKNTIRKLKINKSTIITGIIMFCTFITFLIFNDNLIRTITLYMLLGITYYYNSKITIIYIIVTALSGTFAEMFLMKFAKNTWSYAKPNLFGTPTWLTPLWGIVCITVIEIFTLTNNFTYLFNKK
jgi:hypothetical protein